MESYDFDDNGCMINAHPLDEKESANLALALDQSEELNKGFLTPKGLLPKNVIRISNSYDSYAIWHTPAQEVNLFFADILGIPCGKAHVPALLWKASKTDLSLYALHTDKKPTVKTALSHALFFNIHTDGNVCMGTVDIEINNRCCLDDFIEQWKQYFFESYFSHLIGEHNPVSCNIIQLWQEQVNTGTQFPNEVLKPIGLTVKNIL